MKSAVNQAELLKLLPNLMGLVTKAQAKLASIETHLEVAQDGALRSALPPVNGEPQFTAQFEENSEIFLVAVQEIESVFEEVAGVIDQIEMASAQLVVGVEKQLELVLDPAPETMPQIQFN